MKLLDDLFSLGIFSDIKFRSINFMRRSTGMNMIIYNTNMIVFDKEEIKIISHDNKISIRSFGSYVRIIVEEPCQLPDYFLCCSSRYEYYCYIKLEEIRNKLDDLIKNHVIDMKILNEMMIKIIKER